MARAYGSFADGGFRIDDSVFGNEPRTVVCLENSHGHCSATNKPVLKPALGSAGESEVRAEIMNQLLQGVVTSGTGTAAALPGRAVAGKTGTTENYGDAWFVGYTPQIVTAVWVGYPNSEQPMTDQFHGQPVVGGTYPALIWKAFMTQALAYLKYPPAGLRRAAVALRRPGARRLPQRAAREGQRPLQGHVRAELLPGARARRSQAAR